MLISPAMSISGQNLQACAHCCGQQEPAALQAAIQQRHTAHIAQSQQQPVLCRYRQCLANAAGVSLSSVTVTSQQAGSIVLGTTVAFPAATPVYSSHASSLESSLHTNPQSAFTSDASFASQYGPVAFDSFSLQAGVATAAPPRASLGAAGIEGGADTPPAVSPPPALDVLRPIEAVSAARVHIEYGTFIPVDGYSPPPPPPSFPPPPGATVAPTVAATLTPTPTPTTASSSVGAAVGVCLYVAAMICKTAPCEESDSLTFQPHRSNGVPAQGTTPPPPPSLPRHSGAFQNP